MAAGARTGADTSRRAWELVGGGAVRIADRTAQLSDIRTCEVSEFYEPNVIGHLAALGLFMGIGCLCVLPVAMSLARPKFLIGGALFIGLGLTLLVEILRLRGIHLFHVDVHLRNGESIRFTSADRAEAMALAAAVGSARAR